MFGQIQFSDYLIVETKNNSLVLAVILVCPKDTTLMGSISVASVKLGDIPILPCDDFFKFFHGIIESTFNDIAFGFM